jgi:hypothetical protein
MQYQDIPNNASVPRCWGDLIRRAASCRIVHGLRQPRLALMSSNRRCKVARYLLCFASQQFVTCQNVCCAILDLHYHQAARDQYGILAVVLTIHTEISVLLRVASTFLFCQMVQARRPRAFPHGLDPSCSRAESSSRLHMQGYRVGPRFSLFSHLASET